MFLPVSASQIKEAISKHPDAEAVYLTSPNHEGLICSYSEIRQTIGDERILIIDEAHGSHFYFE